MYGKEDERQIVTNKDIQKTLRTQLNWGLFPLIFSIFSVLFLMYGNICMWIDVIKEGFDSFLYCSLTIYSLLSIVILIAVAIWLIRFMNEHRIISGCYFEVVEDTIEYAGPAEGEYRSLIDAIKYYSRDVMWNSGDRMAQHEANVMSKRFRSRYVYPIMFAKYGRAIYDTFKWKQYLDKGDRCFLVIYDKEMYHGDCNIVRIYPSTMYRYKE